MFKKGISKKTTLFLSLGVSILSIFVCAISTMAWFQLNSQPLKATMISGSGNVNLVENSIFGYKVNPTLGADGKINYDNTTVTKKNGSSISTTNYDLDGIDTNFDIPSEGIGYYLIEQNASNTFTYSYNNVLMGTKFVSKTGSTVNSHYIASKALFAKTYRVKKYTFVSNQTVYEQVPISTTNSSAVTLDASGDNATYDVTITSSGTYKIWLTYSPATDKWDLSLEETSYSPSGKNISSKINKENDVVGHKNATSVSTKSNVTQSGFSDYTFSVINNAGNSFWWQVWNGSKDITLKLWTTGNWTINLTDSTSPTKSEIFTGGTIYVKKKGSDNNTKTEYAINTYGKNYIEINNPGSSSGYYAQTKSILTIKYVDSSGSEIKSSTSITCWNTDSIASSDGWVASPSIPGYTFNGWYTTATGSTTATTNAYISANATIYARYTIHSPSATKYTTYLYDANGTTASPTWTTPKAYVWDSSNYYNPSSTTISYSERTTHNGHYVYKFEISVSYNGLLFNNNGTNGNNNQTIDLAQSAGKNKYYVITSNTVEDNGYIKYSGNWYTSLVSENTRTYYYYDVSSPRKLGDTPSAYAWASSGVTSDSDNYSIYSYQNSSWPGVSMEYYTSWSSSEKTTFTAAHPNVDTSNVWRIVTSEDYDKIIFDNGTGGYANSDQTIDLIATGHEGWFFVLTGDTSGGRWDGTWAEDVYGITLKASFFIKTASGTSKSSLVSQTIDTDYTFGIEKFNAPTASYSNITYPDSANGILYIFSDLNSGTDTWYTDENCTSQYSATSAAANLTLYRKFIVDFSGDDYTTFYIDVSNSGTGTSSTYWQNISICGSGGSDEPYFSSTSSSSWKIGTNLYRVTLPTNYIVRVANSGFSSTGGNNTSSTFAVNGSTGYLYVNKAASGSNCSITWCNDLATNIGTATIYVKGPDDDSFTGTVMSIGDQTSNDFVYELGLQIEVGSQIYVDVLETDNTHNYYKYPNYINDIPSYIGQYVNAGDMGNGNILTQNYSGTARFNFYITHNSTLSNRKLSIAMVPDYGNGYYIMPYNSSYGTSTYSGAIKMSSGSSTSASYSGFYAAAGTEIYIRSYLDAVDTLYTESTSLAPGVYLGTKDGSTATASGVLHFTNAGYYDIDVYNGKITVTAYNISDFFKLNALDTDKVSTTENIKNQKTSLVIEVQFTCNNTYASKMTLTANNGMSEFVGAALYCSSEALDNPYDYLRRNCYDDITSTNNVINDSNSGFVVPKNSSNSYYAYILIDYLPTNNSGSYVNFLTNYKNNIYFYLNATQYIS